MKKQIAIILITIIMATVSSCNKTGSTDTTTNLAFGKALWDIYQTGTLPDGQMLEYIDTENAAKNNFAIADVDGDGQDELILSWSNTSMAGMVKYVFGYKDGSIYTEFSEFPSIIFYDNGIATADWSHNQGLAGEFWPYNIYSYDPESDTYQPMGSVDAWDKNLSDTNYDGISFPSDIDSDKDGIVYYLLSPEWNGYYDNALIVDGAEYEHWKNIHLEGASAIEIPFQSLTEENISALGYPMPERKLPQPLG